MDKNENANGHVNADKYTGHNQYVYEDTYKNSDTDKYAGSNKHVYGNKNGNSYVYKD